jgi:hypothetical protein
MRTGTKRRRAGFGTALMVAGGLFILSAALLFLYNDTEDTKASEAAVDIAGEFTDRVAAPENAPEREADSGGEIYITTHLF